MNTNYINKFQRVLCEGMGKIETKEESDEVTHGQFFGENIRRIKRYFCKHDWKIDDPNEILPSPKTGEAVAYSRPHTCSKCGKKTILGSGWIC